MTPAQKEQQRLRNAKPENVRRRAAYARTPAGREAARRATRKYDASVHGRIKNMTRRETPEDRARAAAISRKWYAEHKGQAIARMRVTALWSRFGLTPEDYDIMLAEQDGVCAVCKAPPPASGRVRRLAVDHDRNCCPGTKSCGNCVRGLLCSNCNVSIGLLADSTERVQALLDYLVRAA